MINTLIFDMTNDDDKYDYYSLMEGKKANNVLSDTCDRLRNYYKHGQYQPLFKTDYDDQKKFEYDSLSDREKEIVHRVVDNLCSEIYDIINDYGWDRC